MSRETSEPGLETRPPGSQFNALSISPVIPLILQLEWQWRTGCPTHLCQGSCAVEKLWEE